MPVIAGMVLAGCTATAPMQPYYSSPLPDVWNAPPPYNYLGGGVDYAPRPAPTRQYFVAPPRTTPQQFYSVIRPAEAAAPPPAPAPQIPLRAVDPPYSHEIDADCGWWRFCNFWR